MESKRQLVLFGPPLCGKRTLLGSYAESQGSKVERTMSPCGSDSFPHWVIRASLNSDTDLVTIGGSVWNIDVWWPLIAGSHAVVLMLDSQAVREAANEEHVRSLAAAPGCPRIGCVVWTKEDLVTTRGLERASLSIPSLVGGQSFWRSPPGFASNGPIMANWPTFSTRFDESRTMLAPITFLMSDLEPGGPDGSH